MAANFRPSGSDGAGGTGVSQSGDGEHLRGLRTFPRMLMVLLAAVVVPLVSLGGYGLWQTGVTARQDAEQRMRATAELIRNRANEWEVLHVESSRQLVALPAMKSMDSERIRPVLTAIAGQFGGDITQVLDLDGQQVVRSDGRSVTLADGEPNPKNSRADREYYLEVAGGAEFGSQSLIGRTTGRPLLYSAHYIRGADGEPAGVLARGTTLEALAREVSERRVGRTGYIILLDDASRLLAYGGANPPELLSVQGDHPGLTLSPGAVGEAEVGGVRVLTTQTTSNLGLRIVVQQDHDEIFAPVAAERQRALVVLGVALAVAIVMAFLLSRALAGPLSRLTEAADQVSRGDMGTTIPSTYRQDEVGGAARGVSAVAGALRTVMIGMVKN